MGQTTFSGPVESLNGFIGDVTGTFTGNVTGNVTGNLTGNSTGKHTGTLQYSTQNLSGAGAANLTTAVTLCTSTGAGQVVTLANATGNGGFVKTIVHVADGGSIVVTPATCSGFTTVTLADVGQSVNLLFTGAAWVVLSTNGGTIA